MREVIYIKEEKQVEEKPVEFTHYLSTHKGWDTAGGNPLDFEKVIYLGKDKNHGDMFAAYDSFMSIYIYKGHLNSGKY